MKAFMMCYQSLVKTYHVFRYQVFGRRLVRSDVLDEQRIKLNYVFGLKYEEIIERIIDAGEFFEYNK